MSELIKMQDIIDWCDKMTEEGKRPILKWEGGGDSGWCYMEDEDGERLDSHPEAQQLTDYMYDNLDYGSWAGEFTTNGEAPYNEKTKSFEGTDYYSETEGSSCDANIKIRIPREIMFDTFEIETSGYHEEHLTVECDISLRNGFLHPHTKEVMDSIKQQLSTEIQDTIDKYQEETDVHIENYYNNYRINRSDFKVVNDYLGNYYEYILDTVEFSVMNEDPKDVYLDLNELKENQNED